MSEEPLGEEVFQGEESFTTFDVTEEQRAPKFINRLTVIQKAYFQSGDDDPVSAENAFSIPLKLEREDQVYERHHKIYFEDAPIAPDCGWVGPTKASLIVIENHPPKRATLPSPEERESDAKKILLVEAGGIPVTRIRPGEMFSFSPPDASKLTIRSLFGDIRYTIYAFPE